VDDGVRSRREASVGVWISLALGAAVVGAILVRNWSYHRQVERVQGWVADAPGCAVVSAAEYASRGYRARERSTEYDGVTFGRQFGHVICKDVDTPGGWGFVTHPVCQFTSPTAIRVQRGRSETFFEPGPGRRATVSIRSGRPACRLSSKFSLFVDPTN
jgi:hypothetical protein